MNNTCKHYNREVRAFIATDDIVHHIETCRDCHREVYHVWNYNDGGSTPGRDSLKRVICDYRPIADAPSPEREAVNEALAQEPLTVSEIIARMPEGWTLLPTEHFNRVVKAKNDYRHDLMKYLEINGFLHGEAGRLAYALSSAGEYPHKEKNEVVLRVIARLFAMQMKSSPVKDAPPIDDIPF